MSMGHINAPDGSLSYNHAATQTMATTMSVATRSLISGTCSLMFEYYCSISVHGEHTHKLQKGTQNLDEQKNSLF